MIPEPKKTEPAEPVEATVESETATDVEAAPEAEAAPESETATEAEAGPEAEPAPEAEPVPVESDRPGPAAAADALLADQTELDTAEVEEVEVEAVLEAAPDVDPRDAEIADLKDKLLRAAAEVENIRRRSEREREEAHKFAVSRFAKDLCEVADNLRRAIDSTPADKTGADVVKNLLDGVGMTERAMHEVFERYGIRRIDPAGEKFDPNLHEAMTEIDDPDAAPGTVVQVFQTGYVINDRLLRPARVIIAKRNGKNQGQTVDTLA